MGDRVVRTVATGAALTAAAAATAVVVACGARPLVELLEAVGVIDPFHGDRDLELLDRRVAAVEDRWSRFDENWPEPYRHAAATAAFDRIGATS